MESNSRTGSFSCLKFNNNNDSASIFQIPSEMVRSYGETLPEKATLRIDNSGKCWNVRVEKFKDHYFFTDGWEQFAHDVDIKSWECLILNYSQIMSEYSPDADGYMDFNSGEDKDGATDEEDALCFGDEWGFTKELKKTNAKRIVIPKKFAIGTGIAKTRKLTLIDVKGGEWPVRVHVENRNCGDFYSMGTGWTDFVIANKAVIGSTMSFKLVSCSKSNVMIEAKVVCEGTDGKALSDFVKRKRGRSEDVTYEQEDSSNSSLKINCESMDFGEDRRLSFSKELKAHNLYSLSIPNKIVIGAGITKASKIKLKDAERREWPLRVTVKNCREFSFTAGWSAFLVSNKVVVGSTISFNFTSNDTIEARVVKMGTDENALFSCVRRNGGKHEVSASHERPVSVKCVKSTSLTVDRVSSRLSFSTELMKHHVYTLDIPKCFATGTGVDKNREIKLQGGGGRIWTVQVTERNNRFSMSTGWYDFLKENNVVVGSTMSFVSSSANTVETHILKEGSNKHALFKFMRRRCKSFELPELENTCDHHVKLPRDPLAIETRNEDNVMYEKAVSDFVKRKRRRSEDVASCTTSAYKQDSSNVSLKINCESKDFGEDRRLSFSEELEPKHVHVLRIPKEIVFGAGMTKASKIKLKDAEGREWPVRVTDKNCSYFSFTAGWNAFLVSNNVLVGSTVSFNFTSNDTIEVRVVKMGTDENALFSCVRRNGGKYEVSASCKRTVRERCMRRTSLNMDCVSTRSSFSKELMKHHVYTLDIPKCFAAGTGVDKSREIKLQGGEGRIWTVQVTERNNQFRMSTGWYDFLRENNVVVGSTVSFVWSSANTVETHILKEGSNKHELFKFIRRRGKSYELLEPMNTCDHQVKVPKDPPSDIETSNEDEVSEDEYDLGVGRSWRYSEQLADDAYKLELPREFSEVTGNELSEEIKSKDSQASDMFKSEIQDMWGLYDDYCTDRFSGGRQDAI